MCMLNMGFVNQPLTLLWNVSRQAIFELCFLMQIMIVSLLFNKPKPY